MDFDFKNPDYTEIILKRQDLARRLAKEPRKLAAFKKYYADGHPAEFINDWGWTFDPRRKDLAYVPFIIFDRQREYLQWLYDRLVNKEDGLCEKSRDMGISYLNVGFASWGWTFLDGFKAGFGSRKEDYVDKIGDPDSIFEKIRIFLRYLPGIFLPHGFSADKHIGFCKAINPANGSVITGEAGDNIGRGGRNSIYFKDESAHYEHPEKIDAALSENCDVKIDCSSVNGTGNPFYRKRFSGKIPVFIFDWRQDPRKDQEWYDKKKATEDPWIVAQEIDRDYAAAVEDVCIPAKWVQAAFKIKLQASGRRTAGLDVADEGESGENALAMRHGPVVTGLDVWSQGNTTQTARKAVRLCSERSVEVLFYDSIGVGAGVKGETASLADLGQVDFQIQGINAGETDLPGLWDEGKANEDMFLNLRAEMWWSMRRRFRRTWERVEGEREWPDEDCISLAGGDEEIQKLVAELSQPKVEHAENGKIRIESKKKMSARGVRSPNRADALMLAFAPVRYFRFEAFGGSMGHGARLWGKKARAA